VTVLENRREQNLTALFRPRSVAIVGASDDVVRISGRPVRYLKESGFSGSILPVNPRREVVQGLKSYPSVASLPEVPDVALLAIPADLIPAAVRECAALGVKAAVIFSSGFAEMGEKGAQVQDEIRDIARASGMRVLGPNCLGLFNSKLGFYGTFASALDMGFPVAGGVAIASQSGAYGAHVAYLAQQRGIGVRYCISTGNEADIDIGEALLWLARDPDVRVIMAYAEGLRDSATFIEALRTAHERRIPIVFMKVGRSAIGAGAIDSHTAALAGADAVYDAVFRQYGVHRALTTDEQIDVAYACARGFYPRGRKLGIVTVSGGVGVQTCDAAERYGLDVTPMPADAQAKLKALLPYAAVGNPVDVTAQALVDMSVLTKSLELMLEECDYDALVGIFLTVPTSRPFAAPLREAIAQAARSHRDRLIVMCMVADPDIVRSYEELGFLVYEDAYRAVAALAALTRLRESFDRGLAAVPAVVRATAPIGASPLSEHDAKQLLSKADIRVLPERLARSAGEAFAAAEAVGYPVAMKIVSPDIQHKTEIGGVMLNVADGAAAKAAFESLERRARATAPHARIDGVLVAPMAPSGVDTIVGVTHDATFGPVVMFGLGGIFVEVFRDVTFRLAPFADAEAHRMVREIAGHALLEGARGTAPCDVDALAQALVRVSEFAAAHAGEIESVDINPLRVLPRGNGVVALDALIVPRRTRGDSDARG
jgi:acyl-CoA synthetase (NDP forming)